MRNRITNLVDLCLRARYCPGILLLGIALALSGQPCAAQQNLTGEQERFFESKIRPVLIRECYSCHSSEVGQVRGGLWLDTAQAMRTGGDSGPGVVPGNLEESLVWNALNHRDFAMPPRRKLSDEILADFKLWIEMGAPDPRVSDDLQVRSGISEDDIQKGREFWSFKNPQRPQTVQLNEQGKQWSKHTIDHFVWDKLNAHGLPPAPEADPLTMLRRLTFDLVGLPPTEQQIQQFQRASKADPDRAVRSMVDQLLDSPRFGERWGRHWLDLARYAESTGREVNIAYPHAWRYRDYVIDSFNSDKPYNRFVTEQIAGDLLPAKSDQQWAEQLVATGFMALGAKTLSEQNGRQFELDLIDEQIDVTTRVMLGVSVACARCHDHKFDPIPQTDYYALSGIFRGMSTHYGTFRTQQNRRPSNLLMMPVEDEVPFDQPISGQQLESLKKELTNKREELREALLARRDRQTTANKGTVQAKVVQVAQLSSVVGILQAKIDSYDEKGRPLALCMGVQETEPVDARLLERGEFSKPAQEVPRGIPQVLCAEPLEIPSSSTGRLEFARWVGSSENPLTARVMVNRIWQHLVGQPIVRTPEDFGSTGQPPTHPELLDYLAVSFMENGWSIKQLIREITSSSTYRMSSRFDPASFEADPENRYLWRMEKKRLEAEAIRDSLLAASDELDLSRPRGSILAQAGTAIIRDGNIVALSVQGSTENTGIAGRVRDSVFAGLSGTSVLKPSVHALDQPVFYRSVYLPVVRDNIPRSLEVLDFAESTMVIGVRESSNTADQGLFFLNNSFVIERAQNMARRLQQDYPSSKQQIQQAFWLAYSRPATEQEMQSAMDFYRDYEPGLAEPRGRPGKRQSGAETSRQHIQQIQLAKLSALCQSLLASAEFRYIN